MKLLMVIFLVLATVLEFSGAAEVNCDNPPKNISCCNHYEHDQKEAFEKCESQVTVKNSTAFCQAANCLLTELKLYKDKKIDKEGIAKFIGDSIKDDAWKSAAKETSEYCVKEIEKRKVELIKEYKEEPYGIKEEDCDVVPWVLLSCFIIQSDNKCPKEHRNPSDDCKYNYDFIEKCSNKTDIFSEIKEGMKSLNDQL